MRNKKKKWILYIAAGCMALVILFAGGAYYMLTRYYFYNVHNIHAKKAVMKHLEDEAGQQFEAYLWLYSLLDRGDGDTYGPDYSSYVSDTYVEAGAESLTYGIEENEEGYKVSVYDSRENLLYEDSYKREPVVKRIGKNTLEIHEGAGNTWWSVFINGETGEVSEPFADVVACNEQTVVYSVFEDGIFKIIIRDVYDEDVYQEITDDFPPVATGISFIKEAKVLDGHTVYLDYYIGDSGNGDECEEKKIVVN